MAIIGQSTQTKKTIEIRKPTNNVYLTSLSIGSFFKETDYIDKIKTVKFVNYINKEDLDSALKTYELADTMYSKEANDIMGWIDQNYNLYIGSDWNIYSKDFSYAFYNMTAVTRILFDNLNLSENTNLNYTFYGDSSLNSLDLTKFNISNVVSYSNMFYGVDSKISITVIDASAKDFIDLRLNEAGIIEGNTNIVVNE